MVQNFTPYIASERTEKKTPHLPTNGSLERTPKKRPPHCCAAARPQRKCPRCIATAHCCLATHKHVRTSRYILSLLYILAGWWPTHNQLLLPACLLNCCWPSPAQWLLGLSLTGLMTLFYCLMALETFQTLWLGRSVSWLVKLLLALASTIILGFESCWDPWPSFLFSPRHVCV
jgi:hypothetical protein